MRVPGVALAIVACAACAPVPVLRQVPPDGGGWRELRTDHFVLRTDFPSDRARDLLAELEAVVDGLHKGLFGGRPKELSLAVDVVAFESKRDLDLFLPANAEAITSPDPRWSRLTIIIKGSFGELGRCPEALRLQRRAVENIRESDRAGQLKRYLDRLVSLEQSCGAPGAVTLMPIRAGDAVRARSPPSAPAVQLGAPEGARPRRAGPTHRSARRAPRGSGCEHPRARR